MKQLSSTDTAFLNLETPTQFGHVSSIIILDPSTGSGGDVYSELKRTMEERLHLLEVYRRKLLPVPLGLDNPYWIDDADLDLEYHLREIAIPAPGTERQFAEQISRIVSRPLDRSRPLWEFYVVSGLEGGLVGILTKIHHSTIDGASGVELLHVLLDRDPSGRPIEPPAQPWSPEPAPSPLNIFTRTMLGYAIRPVKVMELQLRLLRAGAKLSGSPVLRAMIGGTGPVRALRRLAGGPGESAENTLPPRLPLIAAPPTPFNRAITAHRRFAFRTLALKDAQTIKRAFGVTVNDVVMALCGSALRRYLIEHDALPRDPLIAMVPVSIRSGDESDTYTNRVTGLTCSLHTDLDEPVARLQAIHGSMAAAKELQRAIPATVLTDITEFTPPVLSAQASRLITRTRIANRLRPPFNVIISNVPGPREPLFLSGSTMRHFYPVSTIAEGQGLNLTVQSYLDNLDFGFIACRELVPDLWDLCDHLEKGMEELKAAV